MLQYVQWVQIKSNSSLDLTKCVKNIIRPRHSAISLSYSDAGAWSAVKTLVILRLVGLDRKLYLLIWDNSTLSNSRTVCWLNS